MTKKELFEKEPKKGLEWIQIMIQLKNLNYIIAVLQKSHNFVINNLFTLFTINDFISKFAEFFLPGIGNSVVPAQSRILQWVRQQLRVGGHCCQVSVRILRQILKKIPLSIKKKYKSEKKLFSSFKN